VKDFNDPGKGGDFLWWLTNHRHYTAIEAARAVLKDLGVADPSSGPSIHEIHAEATVAVNAGAAPAPASPPRYPMTDMGNGERFAAQAKGEYLYNTDSEVWMHWTGTVWEKDASCAIQQLAKRVIRDISLQVLNDTTLTDGQKKTMMTWARKSEAESRRNSMINMARSEPGMTTREGDFDQNLDELNCASGIIDLKSGTVRPATPGDRMSRCSPWALSDRKPELFSAFIEEIFEGRKELIDWMQVYLGYSLTGRTSAQVFPIWWGSGANGKSQLLAVLGSIMGDYCQKTSTETWLQNHSGSPVRDDLAMLRGARFVWASEPDAGKKLSISTIKEVTGGDPITCRHLYGRLFTYIPTYKSAFVTNHRPRVESQDYGTWRRVKFIPFTYTVPEHRRIPDLAQLLLEKEGPEIFGWFVEGAIRWYEEGRLPDSELIHASTEELKLSDDPLAEFLLERCVIAPNLIISFDQLWGAYNRWCQDKQMPVKIPRQLFKRLIGERNDMVLKSFAMKAMVEGVGEKENWN
jgi:putative DNA primase/helicase